MLRGIATTTFILSLCVAIYFTDNASWLTAWLILLVFSGLPLLLLSLRDLFSRATSKWQGRGPLLLHTCAIFAAILGYGAGWMAVDSGHPKAHLHQLLVVIFPLFVYATPVLMLLHGLPFSELKYYYSGKESDENA